MSKDTLIEILSRLQTSMHALLGDSMTDIILFGSYARDSADAESDIDVMILCDMSRSDIATLNWRIGEIASTIMLDYGILVSPIVENKSFFLENADIMPFFRNIRDEGVRISA